MRCARPPGTGSSRRSAAEAGLRRLLAAAALLLLAPMPARADGPSLAIHQIEDHAFPHLVAYVGLVVEGAGGGQGGEGAAGGNEVGGPSFRVAEDGRPVLQASIRSLESSPVPLDLVLALDTSGSMAGEPLADAIEAATAFVRAKQAADELALLAFHDVVELRADFTPEPADLEAALAGLVAGGDTALYDAVVEAAGRLQARQPGRRAVLVLSDGADTASRASLEEALAAVEAAGAPLFAVGLGQVARQPLERLVEASGGSYLEAAESAELADRFLEASRQLRQQFEVSFTSALLADGQLHELQVEAELDGRTYRAWRGFQARPGPVTVRWTSPESELLQPRWTVELGVQVTSPGPLRSVRYELDGELIGEVTAYPHTLSWEVPIVIGEEPGIVAEATDSAGNRGRTERIFQMLPDAPPPTLPPPEVPEAAPAEPAPDRTRLAGVLVGLGLAGLVVALWGLRRRPG